MKRGTVDPETEPIVSVTLHIYRNGSLSTKDQEFSLRSTVGQLKEDMEKELDIPAGFQVWRYQDRELEDHLTLSAQEVDCDEVIVVTAASP